MNKIIFTEKAFEEYLYWQTQDRKTLRRINLLLKDIARGNFDGIGKPESLRGKLTGFSGAAELTKLTGLYIA